MSIWLAKLHWCCGVIVIIVLSAECRVLENFRVGCYDVALLINHELVSRANYVWLVFSQISSKIVLR